MAERRNAAGRLTDEAVIPVDSSTVLLLRDAPAPPSPGGGEARSPVSTRGATRLEVLLLERHLAADFAGGALAFPGGKVTAEDRALPPERWRGPELRDWREPLGVRTDDAALGFLVAAVRETFEEVGVLLAVREDGSSIVDDELAAPSFRTAREQLASRGDDVDWRPWLEREGLVLDLDALALWSWWVTPQGQHRRFDTRFFLAAAPPDQVAEHDAVEATAVTWTPPADALAARERGEVTIIFPTRRNLEALVRFGSVADAMRAARAGEVDRRRIVPSLVTVGGRTMVQHPYEDAPSEL